MRPSDGGRSTDGLRTAVTRATRAAVASALVVTLVACSSSEASPTPSTSVAVSSGMPTLRDAAGSRLLIGTAAAYGERPAGADHPAPLPTDEGYLDLLARQFSSITPENQLKWPAVHPEPGRYDFTAGDAVVDLAEAHGQSVRGHTLLWYSQTPSWLDPDALTDDELREVLHDHVETVVGHYRGRVAAWDVANEIVTAAGELRTAQDPFLDRFGISIVADAFRWAHEADPDAVLYLNDVDVELGGAKLDAYLALATELLDEGVPLGGFGIQGHLSLDRPFPENLESTLQAFADLGLDVAITELDVRMPLSGGVPTPEQLDRQAEYYARAVAACVAVERCVGVTVWGATDRYSWVPSFDPDQGAATPFDEDGRAKPAVAAMIAALTG